MCGYVHPAMYMWRVHMYMVSLSGTMLSAHHVDVI